MVQRNLLNKIKESLTKFPVVGIVGSRQVGKTTLAKELASLFSNSIYLDLELPSDINKMQNAELYLKENCSSLIIIDEIQRMPSIFPVLRALVDQDRRPARFLILGSASPIMVNNASESLAGRIIYHELSAFTFWESEKTSAAINELWIRGGYPLSLLNQSEKESFEWREAFIKTFLEQDIPQLGIRIPAIQLRRFWNMLAHNHGQLWNASKIALALGITAPTTKNYLDILTDTFLVRQLSPYFTNAKKRIVKAPKIFMRDSGLLHTFLGVKTKDQLLGNPIAGFSWEGFVIEQIAALVKGSYELFFYRTGAGAEIDLLLVRNNKPEIAIEIKFSLTPKLTKGFWISFEELKCKSGFVIYPGNDIYSINENVKVTGLNNLQNLIELVV